MSDAIYGITESKSLKGTYSKAEIGQKLKNISANLLPLAWTPINQSVFTGAIRSICYGNGKFVAGGINGTNGFMAYTYGWQKTVFWSSTPLAAKGVFLHKKNFTVVFPI